MFKRSGRGPLKSFCINEECSEFVPEEKRSYKKKTTAKSGDKKTAAKKKTTTGKAKE